MRLPKSGERGFTLIELLIVVAILGVLAAVVIPNVQRFIGAGTEEAADTEFADIQAAVSAMMVDNEISRLPCPVDGVTADGYDGTQAINNMSLFPDASSNATDLPGDGTTGYPAPGKVTDPEGYDYDFPTDKVGYVLYGHDISGSVVDATKDPTTNPDQANVNYVATATTTYFYTVDASGTVSQWDAADPLTRTKLN